MGFSTLEAFPGPKAAPISVCKSYWWLNMPLDQPGRPPRWESHTAEGYFTPLRSLMLLPVLYIHTCTHKPSTSTEISWCLESYFALTMIWSDNFGIGTLFSAFLDIWRCFLVSRLLLPVSMETKQDARGPVLLVAFMIMLHAKLCLSTIIFLIYVCMYVLAPREDV